MMNYWWLIYTVELKIQHNSVILCTIKFKNKYGRVQWVKKIQSENVYFNCDRFFNLLNSIVNLIIFYYDKSVHIEKKLLIFSRFL